MGKIMSLLYQLRIIDKYVERGGIEIGNRSRITRGILVPVPFYPPHIVHNVTWDRTKIVELGSLRRPVWAMARPNYSLTEFRSFGEICNNRDIYTSFCKNTAIIVLQHFQFILWKHSIKLETCRVIKKYMLFGF